jgi:hypothetical protein
MLVILVEIQKTYNVVRQTQAIANR